MVQILRVGNPYRGGEAEMNAKRQDVPPISDLEVLARPVQDHFTVYAIGLVCASVCTNLSDEEATRRLNWQHPTGVGPWHIASDRTFRTGEANPHPCERGEGR